MTQTSEEAYEALAEQLPAILKELTAIRKALWAIARGSISEGRDQLDLEENASDAKNQTA